MFSKSKNGADSVSDASAAASPVKRSSAKQGVPSIISNDMKIVGTIESTSDVQFDGALEGDISAATTTVGENAIVTGWIRSDEAVVRGSVKGGIRARKVQLASTARVEGDIHHATLAVEAGAFFEGQCHREDDPLKPEKSRPTATTGTPDKLRLSPAAEPAKS